VDGCGQDDEAEAPRPVRAVQHLSPPPVWQMLMREHIRRFGQYVLTAAAPQMRNPFDIS
jgi:hypothetical protein